ncbi:MAG: hypothetical protein ABFS32_14655 [Bacteroidota bacterium]
MKKIIALLLVSTLTTSILYAQCDQLLDYNEGTTWEYTNYDKKGKVVGKSVQKVVDMSTTANGLEVTLSTVITTDGEEMPPMEMTLICKDGVIYYDMKKFVPDQYLNGEDDGPEIKIEGNNLEMPTNMKAGDVLNDASVKMSIGAADSPIPINMTVDIINRKVEAEENLNTPAGDFNCFVITQSVKTKLLMTFTMDSKEWYTPGVGMIKSETYNKKGKLTDYSVLTGYTK